MSLESHYETVDGGEAPEPEHERINEEAKR
jgi:hypothetical protein